MLMLTTNMIRKDLSSQNQYEAGLALCKFTENHFYIYTKRVIN